MFDTGNLPTLQIPVLLANKKGHSSWKVNCLIYYKFIFNKLDKYITS